MSAIDYTALYLASTISRSLSPLNVDALAYVQGSYGLIERAFQLADIETEIPLNIPPTLRGLMARELMRAGEFVGKIDFHKNEFRIIPAQSQTVIGKSPYPDQWTYQLTIPSPTGNKAETISAAGVVHPRQNASLESPWIGRSSLLSAFDSGRLASSLEVVLGDLLNSPIGSIIPVPDGTPPETIARFKSDLKILRGGVAVPETTQAGFGLGQAAAPQRDWVPQRLAPEVPESLTHFRNLVGETIASCLGVPGSLLGFGNVEGTALREDWRRCMHSTIEPMGTLIATELSEKLETKVSISFNKLEASDTQGRARAFASMTDDKIDGTAAAAIAGFGQNIPMYHPEEKKSPPEEKNPPEEKEEPNEPEKNGTTGKKDG